MIDKNEREVVTVKNVTAVRAFPVPWCRLYSRWRQWRQCRRWIILETLAQIPRSLKWSKHFYFECTLLVTVYRDNVCSVDDVSYVSSMSSVDNTSLWPRFPGLWSDLNTYFECTLLDIVYRDTLLELTFVKLQLAKSILLKWQMDYRICWRCCHVSREILWTFLFLYVSRYTQQHHLKL
jgi:hypothetical protein